VNCSGIWKDTKSEGTRLRYVPARALIEMQLDHDDPSTRAIYDRGDGWDERAELMQHWADLIDRCVPGVERPINPNSPSLPKTTAPKPARLQGSHLFRQISN
jgi:hypothetical protein